MDSGPFIGRHRCYWGHAASLLSPCLFVRRYFDYNILTRFFLETLWNIPLSNSWSFFIILHEYMYLCIFLNLIWARVCALGLPIWLDNQYCLLWMPLTLTALLKALCVELRLCVLSTVPFHMSAGVSISDLICLVILESLYRYSFWC